MNEPVATVWFDAGSPVGRRVATGRVGRLLADQRKGVDQLQRPGEFH